jgi:peptide/nickel transport system permease protein
MTSRIALARESVTVYRENRPALIGAAVVAALAFVAGFAPALTSYDPLKGGWDALTRPHARHLLGTDDLGRDVFAQILYGLRVSFLVGIVSTSIATIIGVLIGALSGFFGGMVDDVLMRFTELFQVIPRFFLAILLVAVFGQHLLVITLAIAVLSWPPITRVVRAEFLSKREWDYVIAARAVGAKPLHIIFREILPNTLSATVVTASLNIGTAILLESGLAFIGLSDASQVSLGRSLQLALPFVKVAWWLSLFPGAALALLILGVNLVGDGINDVFNPRLRR